MQKNEQIVTQNVIQGQISLSSQINLIKKHTSFQSYLNLNEIRFIPIIQKSSLGEILKIPTIHTQNQTSKLISTVGQFFTYLEQDLGNLLLAISQQSQTTQTKQQLTQIIEYINYYHNNNVVEISHRNNRSYQNEDQNPQQSLQETVVKQITSFLKKPTQQKWDSSEFLVSKIKQILQQNERNKTIQQLSQNDHHNANLCSSLCQFIDTFYNCFNTKYSLMKQELIKQFHHQTDKFLQQYEIIANQRNMLLENLFTKQIAIESVKQYNHSADWPCQQLNQAQTNTFISILKVSQQYLVNNIDQILKNPLYLIECTKSQYQKIKQTNNLSKHVVQELQRYLTILMTYFSNNKNADKQQKGLYVCSQQNKFQLKQEIVNFQQSKTQKNEFKQVFHNISILLKKDHLKSKQNLQDLLRKRQKQLIQSNKAIQIQQSIQQFKQRLDFTINERDELKNMNNELYSRIQQLQIIIKQKQQENCILTLQTKQKHSQLNLKMKELQLQVKINQNQRQIIQQIQHKYTDLQSIYERTIRMGQNNIKQVQQSLKKAEIKNNKQFQNIKQLTQQNKQLKAKLQNVNKQIEHLQKNNQQLNHKLKILQINLQQFEAISKGNIAQRQIIQNQTKQLTDLKHQLQMNIKINISNEALFKKLQDQNKDLIKQLVKLQSKIPKCEPIFDQDQFEELNQAIHFYEQTYKGIDPQKYFQMEEIIAQLQLQLQNLKQSLKNQVNHVSHPDCISQNIQKRNVQNSQHQGQIVLLNQRINELEKINGQLFQDNNQLYLKCVQQQKQLSKQVFQMSQHIQALQNELAAKNLQFTPNQNNLPSQNIQVQQKIHIKNNQLNQINQQTKRNAQVDYYIISLEQQIARLNQMINQQNGQIQQFREQLQQKQYQIELLHKDLDQLQLRRQNEAKLQQQLAKISEENYNLRVDIKNLHKQRQTIQQQNQQAIDEIDTLRQHLQEKQKQLQQKEQNCNIMKQLLQNLQKQNIQSITKSLQINSECQAFLIEIKTLKIQKDNLEQTYRQYSQVYEQQIAELYKKIKYLEQQILSQMKNYQTTKVQLEQLKLINTQLKNQQLQLKEQLKQQQQQNIQNRNLQDKFMEILKDNKQLSQVILENQQQLEQRQKQINQLEQELINQQASTKQKQQQIEKMGVLIQTQIQDIQAQMKTKQQNSKEQMTLYQNQVQQLKSKYQQQNLKMATLKQKYQSLVDENTKLLNQIQQIPKNYCQEIQKMLSSYRQTISSLQNELQKSKQAQEQQRQQCKNQNQIMINLQNQIQQLNNNNTQLLKNYHTSQIELELTHQKLKHQVQQRQNYSKKFSHYEEKYAQTLKVMEHLKQQNNKFSKELLQNTNRKVVIDTDRKQNTPNPIGSVDELKQRIQQLSKQKVQLTIKAGQYEQQLILSKKINDRLRKTQNRQGDDSQSNLQKIVENSESQVLQDLLSKQSKQTQKKFQYGQSIEQCSSLGERTESQLDMMVKMSQKFEDLIRQKRQLQRKCIYYQNNQKNKVISFVRQIQACIRNLVDFLFESKLLDERDIKVFVFNYEDSIHNPISPQSTHCTFSAYFQNFFKRLFENIVTNIEGNKKKQEHQDLLGYLRYLLNEYLEHKDQKAIDQMIRVLF